MAMWQLIFYQSIDCESAADKLMCITEHCVQSILGQLGAGDSRLLHPHAPWTLNLKQGHCCHGWQLVHHLA
jgi:hypothetical protein